MLAFLRRSMVPCWPSSSWVDVAGSGTPVHANQHCTVSINSTLVTCLLPKLCQDICETNAELCHIKTERQGEALLDGGWCTECHSMQPFVMLACIHHPWQLCT